MSDLNVDLCKGFFKNRTHSISKLCGYRVKNIAFLKYTKERINAVENLKMFRNNYLLILHCLKMLRNFACT